MLSALAAVIILAQATPDAAQPPASTHAPTPAEAAGGKTVAPVVVTPEARKKESVEVAKSVVVCHNETVLGSMFPKKVCATKLQFEQRRDSDQDEVRKWQSLRPYKTN